MNDLILTKTGGGIGRQNPSGDMISGLLANGVAVPGGVQLDTVYRLSSLNDVTNLLIDADYDTATALVFEHLNEFFRVNPDGELYLMLVEQTVSFVDMVDPTEDYAKALLVEAEGNIKQLAVAYNPDVAVTDFTDADAVITKAQELVADEFSQHRPVQVILEGKGFLCFFDIF